MELEQALEGYPTEIGDAFVAYLVLLAEEGVELVPTLERRLDAFAQRCGIDEDMPTAERQRLTTAYFDEHPFPAPLLSLLASAEEAERERQQTELERAANGLAGSAEFRPKVGRGKGAPPGGHLNILLARSFKS
ncbi:MAG: hypothetical protein IPG45_26695 [Deltaproteobacteria bacterium]|nr:hypothetical protein [Deltaproteobacteria bacterium]